MTAGIAAPSPAAVAISASEMPGATTARLAGPCCPMPWKALMMPVIVPKRPVKGAALAGERARAEFLRRAVDDRESPPLAVGPREAFRVALDGAELPPLLDDEGPADD